MNPNWSDAQNWIDILDHVWIGFVVLAAAAIPSFFAARNHRSIRDIKDQVVNGHADTNLRNDLDRVNASLDDLGKEVRSLRQDLLVEKADRRDQIHDLRHELDHRTGKRHRLD